MKSDRTARLALIILSTIGFLFLFIPIIMVIISSFTPSRSPQIPYDGITLDWYLQTVNNTQLIESLLVSFVVGIIASGISTLVGAAAAFGFVRGSIPYKEYLSTAMMLPMLISPVIVGFAIIRYFGVLNLPSGYPALIIGHATLTVPFTFLLIQSQLLQFDRDLEHASRILGADRTLTFLNVTSPLIAPSIVAAYFIAFVISFGEFTASQFLVSPGVTTIPVVIYNMLVTGLTPEVSVIATVLIIIMIVAAAISEYLS